MILRSTEDVFRNISPNDIVYLNGNASGLRPVLCVKSFPRSGSTYIISNFNANNFICIKKDYNSSHNDNQPMPISVLRNFKDCIASNVIMSNLGEISESNVDIHISEHLKKYTLFVDSFIKDIDGRVPYLFSQLEKDSKAFLESVYQMQDTDKDTQFIFKDISPSRKDVSSYRTGENYSFLPTSKTNDKYKMVFEKFSTLDIFNEIQDKYTFLENKILIRQSDLGIGI